LGTPDEEVYDVVGRFASQETRLAKDRLLPRSRRVTAGSAERWAYGFAMSSQYNSRPRAAEVLVKAGEYRLVREVND